MGRLKFWFRPLENTKGEGSVSTGVKVIIAVVIGALILGGCTCCLRGTTEFFPKFPVRSRT